MWTSKSKQSVYYVVETEDPFLQSISNEIFNNIIILEIKQITRDRTFLRIKGSKSFQLYEISTENFTGITNLKQVITLHLN